MEKINKNNKENEVVESKTDKNKSLTTKENIMKKIKIEKITLNCGTGVDQAKLEKAMKLLKIITNHTPVKAFTKKRIPAFGIRPGLSIGCRVTIRGKEATELLKRLLETISNKLKEKQISKGYFAFGIKEYIEIPGMTFQRDLGILGLDVCVTLTRPGFSIIKKKSRKSKLPKRNRITEEETIQFMKENFNTTIEQNDHK
jgi:large subunit ribosomal protein L5